MWKSLALAGILLAGAGSAFAQNTSLLSRIFATQQLRVCIWPDYFAISYRNPRSRQLEGFEIDNANALARALGVRVQFVDSSFSHLVEDLETDRCDLAMFAIGVTEARQTQLRFSQPHLVSDVYGITAQSNRRVKDWSDIDKFGTVVVVAKGTLHEPLMRARLTAATLVVVDSPAAREKEVQSGRADVFMTDFPFSRRMLAQYDWARLVAPTSTFNLTPYAWAMRPGDNIFFERVEKELAAMKADGRLLRNAQRHGLAPIVVR